MSDRHDEDDRFAEEGWTDPERPAADEDFAPEDFDSDMIASARMMPVSDEGDEDDENYNPRTHPRGEGSSQGAPTRGRDVTPLEIAQRTALLSETARIFGRRRAEAAGHALLRDIDRIARSKGRPAAIRIAAARLAMRHPTLDAEGAERFAGRIARALAPAAASAASAASAEASSTDSAAQADLRAAAQALHAAAECLTRLERRLGERVGRPG